MVVLPQRAPIIPRVLRIFNYRSQSAAEVLGECPKRRGVPCRSRWPLRAATGRENTSWRYGKPFTPFTAHPHLERLPAGPDSGGHRGGATWMRPSRVSSRAAGERSGAWTFTSVKTDEGLGLPAPSGRRHGRGRASCLPRVGLGRRSGPPKCTEVHPPRCFTS